MTNENQNMQKLTALQDVCIALWEAVFVVSAFVGGVGILIFVGSFFGHNYNAPAEGVIFVIVASIVGFVSLPFPIIGFWAIRRIDKGRSGKSLLLCFIWFLIFSVAIGSIFQFNLLVCCFDESRIVEIVFFVLLPGISVISSLILWPVMFPSGKTSDKRRNP